MVASAKDKALLGRPFVISGSTCGRALVLDLSHEALQEGITRGMSLSNAEKCVKNLLVLPPDPSAYTVMNRELEKIAAVYAPLYENDGLGNLYLDLTGTDTLFGAPFACSGRILKKIHEQTGMRPTVSVANNKLVTKIASRVIRPTGRIEIQNGMEASFLAHQSLKLLPGMGVSLMQTAAVTGYREIGELAALTDGEALSLFGKYGLKLRDMALGIDTSPVESGELGEKKIERVLEFAEDVTEAEIIKAGIVHLSEITGIEMRGKKLGTARIRFKATYSDGAWVQDIEKGGYWITDKNIAQAAEKIYRAIVVRRLRIKSIGVSLEDLRPLGWCPDLFEVEQEEKQRKLQEAKDKIRNRYGIGSLTTGMVMVVQKKYSTIPLLPGAVYG
nr:DNA polymerase [Leadbettera azotonutricia]